VILIILITQTILELFVVVLTYVFIVVIAYFIIGSYKNWQRRKRKQQEWDDMIERITRQREERKQYEIKRKERIKYPLFFLKEGIV